MEYVSPIELYSLELQEIHSYDLDWLDTFITELQTQFLLNGHTFIITLNTINGILTFSTTSLNFTFLSQF
jgi:hypothetical protein